MGRILHGIFFVLIFFTASKTTLGQPQAIEMDRDRLTEVTNPLIKNKGLTVMEDTKFEAAGLTLTLVGFRDLSYAKKAQLLVQFKCETGIRFDVAFLLFDEDDNQYWESTVFGVRQPMERNLITLWADFKDVHLKSNSTLYIWAKRAPVVMPYEMWEWQDFGNPVWLEPVANEAPEETEVVEEETVPFYNENEVDTKPVFPGGQNAETKYFSENLKYPAEARKNGTKGMMVISYVVNTDGSIGEVVILKSLGDGCDEVAKRTIEKMPIMTPGMKDGKAVAVKMIKPVRFML